MHKSAYEVFPTSNFYTQPQTATVRDPEESHEAFSPEGTNSRSNFNNIFQRLSGCNNTANSFFSHSSEHHTITHVSVVCRLSVPWIWWSRVILSTDHISERGFPRSTPDSGGSHIWDTFLQILINFHLWILWMLWDRMGRAPSPCRPHARSAEARPEGVFKEGRWKH